MQPKLLPSNVILSRNIFFVLFLNIVPQFFVKRRVAEDKNGNMINLKKPDRMDTIYILIFSISIHTWTLVRITILEC